MKRNWKEDIHDRLGNFETDAPDGLWEAIHQRMAQTEPAKAEKRQTPFVLQPALRRTACTAAACLALVAGYQYFADGGKETVSGVKVAQGGVADISTNRYVAKNAVAPAATVYAQTQNSPAVLQPNGRVEQTADAIAQPTQNSESAQISTSQHLNTSTPHHLNISTYITTSPPHHLNIYYISQHHNITPSQHLILPFYTKLTLVMHTQQGFYLILQQNTYDYEEIITCNIAFARYRNYRKRTAAEGDA